MTENEMLSLLSDDELDAVAAGKRGGNTTPMPPPPPTPTITFSFTEFEQSQNQQGGFFLFGSGNVTQNV